MSFKGHNIIHYKYLIFFLFCLSVQREASPTKIESTLLFKTTCNKKEISNTYIKLQVNSLLPSVLEINL